MFWPVVCSTMFWPGGIAGGASGEHRHVAPPVPQKPPVQIG